MRDSPANQLGISIQMVRDLWLYDRCIWAKYLLINRLGRDQCRPTLPVFHIRLAPKHSVWFESRPARVPVADREIPVRSLRTHHFTSIIHWLFISTFLILCELSCLTPVQAQIAAPAPSATISSSTMHAAYARPGAVPLPPV